jgi:hypothetical protein
MLLVAEMYPARRKNKKLNPFGLSFRRQKRLRSTPTCASLLEKGYGFLFKAGFLARGNYPLTVAAQRWTRTSFHLLSPDIRASGHLECGMEMFYNYYTLTHSPANEISHQNPPSQVFGFTTRMAPYKTIRMLRPPLPHSPRTIRGMNCCRGHASGVTDRMEPGITIRMLRPLLPRPTRIILGRPAILRGRRRHPSYPRGHGTLQLSGNRSRSIARSSVQLIVIHPRPTCHPSAPPAPSHSSARPWYPTTRRKREHTARVRGQCVPVSAHLVLRQLLARPIPLVLS